MGQKMNPNPIVIIANSIYVAFEEIKTSEEIKKEKFPYIKVKVNERLDDLNESSFISLSDNLKPILISFASSSNQGVVKIFWKNSGSETFNFLQYLDYSNEIILRHCLKFLANEIENGRDGILKRSIGKKKLDLSDIGNERNYNLLTIAVIENRDDVAVDLVNHNFDVNYVDSDELIAVDRAWLNYCGLSDKEQKEKCNRIIMCLLKADSVYPRNSAIQKVNSSENVKFLIDNASEEVQDFHKKCLALHECVKLGNKKEFNHKIEDLLSLRHYYDSENTSLYMCAIKEEDFQFRNLLTDFNICIGCHEIEEFSKLSEAMAKCPQSEKELHSQKKRMKIESLEGSHIHILEAKSRISRNNRQHWNHIREAFEILNKNEFCTIILKIVAKCKTLKIFFDFEHESTFSIRPLELRTIAIAAKNLLDESRKYEVIGTLAHELCHAAVLCTYSNKFLPFQMGESVAKQVFEKAVEECKTNQEHEELIKIVFDENSEEGQLCELIVQPVYIMMHHFKDSDKIKGCKDKFNKIFTYFKEFVTPDMKNALAVLDKLNNEDQKIEFEDLTEPMKAKIRHSTLKLRGIECTPFEMIGEKADDILNGLQSGIIRDCLIRETIEIHQSNNESEEKKIVNIERRFVASDEEKVKDLQQVMVEVNSSKVFILTGEAGAGKTTAFAFLEKKLKENFKKHWVCFIKLRNYQKIFDDYMKTNKRCEPLQIFLHILDLEQSIESSVFQHLYKNDQVIFLLDGVDEISPLYGEFFEKVIKLLQKNTKNQVWISSRPRCIEMLAECLKANTHEFGPITHDEKVNLFTSVYENCEEQSKNPIDVVVNDLMDFFELLKGKRFFGEVNNLLMIKSIAELYIKGKIDLDKENLNIYDIFEKLAEMLMGEKVCFRDVHQVLALKFLYGYKDIKNLSIMKRWKDERKNWSVDRIRRLGFVTLDTDFDRNPHRIFIDFIHSTFPEFLLAQFLISIVFDSPDVKFDQNEEIENILNLVCIASRSRSHLYLDFIASFMHRNTKSKIYKDENIDWILSSLIYWLGNKKIKFSKKFCGDESETIYVLKFFSYILINNPQKVEDFWKENLANILRDHNLSLRDVSYTLEHIFGSNWDERLNINQNRDQKKIYCDKGLAKLLNFVENNFAFEDRLKIYKRCHTLESKTILAFITEILEHCSDFSAAEEQSILDAIKHCVNRAYGYKIMSYLREEIEKIIINCKKISVKTKIEMYIRIIRNFFSITFSLPKEHELKNLQVFKDTCIENEIIKSAWRIFFIGNKIDIKTLMKFSDEDVQELKKVLVEIFMSNRLDIFEVFDYSYTRGLLTINEWFETLEIFLSHFDDLNINFKEVVVRKILHEQFGRTLLIDSLKIGTDSFSRVAKFCINDTIMSEKIQKVIEKNLRTIILEVNSETYPKFKEFVDKIFESDTTKVQNLIFDTEINDVCFALIEQKEKFATFEKFLEEYSDGNEAKVNEFMKKELSKYVSKLFCEGTLKSTESINIINNLIELCVKYCDETDVELQKVLKSRNILIKMALNLTSVSCENFTNLINKIFKSNKLKVLEFEDEKDESFRSFISSKSLCGEKRVKSLFEIAKQFFKSKEKVEMLEKFLDGVFNSNEEMKKAVKRNLININFSKLLKEAVKNEEMLQVLNDFITERNCSLEELKADLQSKKYLLDLFLLMSNNCYEILKELLLKIFKSDRESIVDCMGESSSTRCSEHPKKDLKRFEKFLIELFDNRDKKFVGEIIQNVYYFKKYRNNMYICCDKEDQEESYSWEPNEAHDTFLCDDCEILLWIFYHEDLEEIKTLTNFNEKYNLSWELAQNSFLESFPFESIQAMSNEVYDTFEQFLKLVFKTNVEELQYDIAEKYSESILKFENRNCQCFVQTFMKDYENEIYDSTDSSEDNNHKSDEKITDSLSNSPSGTSLFFID